MRLFRQTHPLEDQANEIADRLQRKLTRMGMEHRRAVRGADYEEQAIVRFRAVEASPECVRLRIDVDALPRGVTTARLKDDDVLTDLGHTLGHLITFEDKNKREGVWFCVWLKESNGLPSRVEFSDFCKTYPARTPALTIPIGVGIDGPRWVDLRSLPHLLIAGATGKGKSIFLHSIIASLLNLPPARLHFVFVDLKGGMELGRYKRVPHTSRAHYVRTAKELPLLLTALQAEMERRAAAMEDLADDIDAFNRPRPPAQRWPYIVVVIEELANAMLSKERVKLDGKSETVAVSTERLLADLAARSRATGIHLIFTTQSPRSDVINGIIKANFPARAAFGTASDIDSRVIVDDSRAQGLAAGRMLFMLNADREFYQAPLLDLEECDQLIKRSIRGERWLLPSSKEARDAGDILALLNTAARDLDGVLDVDRLYRAPDIRKRKMTPGRLQELMSILHADGIAKKNAFSRNFRIAVSAEVWRYKYMVKEVDLTDINEENSDDGENIIEGTVVYANTEPIPVLQIPQKATVLTESEGVSDDIADYIRKWHGLGYSRNEMVRRLGIDRNVALKKIEAVLGPSQRKVAVSESHH